MFRLFLLLVLTFAVFVGAGEMIHACLEGGTAIDRIVSADTDCTNS